MQFQLNPEQQLLQDSLRRFLENEYGFDYRRALSKESPQGLAQNWQTFAENGWLAASLQESLGGFGGSIVETSIIAHEFGRALVIEPYIGCAVLGTHTLLAAGSDAQIQRIMPDIAEGKVRIALAYSELSSRGMPWPIDTVAEPAGNGYVLSGQKSLVIGASSADKFLVSARLAQTDHVGLFLVDANDSSISRTDLPLHDGSLAQALSLNGLKVRAADLLGDPKNGLNALRQGLNNGILAICASMIGAMERSIEITAEYLKTRQQFGTPIGSFQVLQHRMADMATEMELARSMLFAAMAAVLSDHADQRDQTVSYAKSLIGRSAKFVCGQAIQLHGGIGMTEEYTVGHYFKYVMVANALLGSSSRHDEACALQLTQACLVANDEEALR